MYLQRAGVLFDAVDRTGPERSREEMTFATVTTIEDECVRPKKLPDPSAEVRLFRTDENVRVRVEKAPGLERPAMTLGRSPEPFHEDRAIVIVESDRAAVVALQDRVLNRSWVVRPVPPGHPSERASERRAPLVTLWDVAQRDASASCGCAQ